MYPPSQNFSFSKFTIFFRASEKSLSKIIICQTKKNAMELVAEKFLKQVAKDKSITEARAAELMDICIKFTAATLGIDFSVVYSSIYSTEYLTTRTKIKCNELELKDCEKECSCVIFEGVCYPRYFPDAKKMNEDPDKYITSLATDELGKIVKLASYLYYNYDGGDLTDNTFDALQYHLQKRIKTRGRLYEKIGAQPIEKIRTILPFPMPSLDKVKPGSRELFDFLLKSQKVADGEGPPGISWSLKLDGASGMITFEKGKARKLYTRGDGILGGDVTYLNEFINLPTIKDSKYSSIVVRGEFILSKDKWKKYVGSYSNPRSFITSKINSGHVTQGLNDIDFVAYEIMSLGSAAPNFNKSTSFKILDALGFKTVENGYLSTPTIFDLTVLYKAKRLEAKYNIDGLVLTIDKISYEAPPATKANTQGLTTFSNPKNTVAFKMRLEEQIRKTKILNIEWNISRYGRLVPVASYESVYVDGVRMHRASVFNAGHIRDWNLGKGSIIKVVRSGDVIPTIIDVEVNPSIEPIFPPSYIKWHWKGNDIYLDDIEGNQTVQIKRMEHFFFTIGVPRLREKTLEKLWLYGYRDIKSVTNAKPADFIKIKGIGKKTAEAHYRNIHEVMRSTRLDRFIPASTTLSLGIGRKLVKQLMRYHPTLMEDDEATLRIVLTKKKIPGFGVQRIENVASNITKFKEFLYSLNKDDIIQALDKDKETREKIKKQGYNEKIRGRTFVTTGFFGRMDYELEDYIYDNMGNFSDTVTSSIAAIVTANLLMASKKITDAQNLNIPVLSMEEFITKYDIPYSKFKIDDEEEYTPTVEPEDRDD